MVCKVAWQRFKKTNNLWTGFMTSSIHPIFIKHIIFKTHMPLAITAQGLLSKQDHRVQSCSYEGNFQWAGSTLNWEYMFFFYLKLTDLWVIIQNCWISFHSFLIVTESFLLFLFFCQEHSHDVCRPVGCDKVGNEDGESTASLQGFSPLIIRIAHRVDESFVPVCSALCLIHFSLVLEITLYHCISHVFFVGA